MNEFTVRVGTWKDGVPTEFERFSGFSSFSAIDKLHEFGRLGSYDGSRFVVRVYRDEEIYAILHIYAPLQLSRVEWAATQSSCSCEQCSRTIRTLGLDVREFGASIA